MDARAFTADALAAAAADGDRVCLSNLVVRHRKRRGAKMFFATASAEAGWDVQLSFMTRRGEAHDDAETSARLTPEAHAAAYEGCAPGATIVKVWGALERVRAAVSSAAESEKTLSGGRAEKRDADGTVPRLQTTSSDANARVKKDIVCPSCCQHELLGACACVASETTSFRVLKTPGETVATLRVERVEFATKRRVGGDAGVSATDDDRSSVADCWLVFDMAYDGSMTEGERGALTRQVTMCVAANRRARIPFRLAVVGDASADGEALRSDAAFFMSENARPGPPADSSGADAGATGEGSVGVPEPSTSPSVKVASINAPRTRPSADWRALPWRAWGAPIYTPEKFFTAAFHMKRPNKPDASLYAARFSERDEDGKQINGIKRVVYLSADADEVLETIHPGDVFVLGGVVDHAPKLDLARRRFESLKRGFFSGSSRDSGGVPFATKRLPLAGHVSLSKNAHLPCLAVAQMLMVFREVGRYREGGLDGSPDGDAERDASSADAADDEKRVLKPKRLWPKKEGGFNASIWGETLSLCPAFRCAPLRKYVIWAPPYEALNEKEGEVKPSRVTDVRALMC